MKIYLVQPPIEDFYATPLRNIPYGLLSIAASLKGHEIVLLDLRQGKPHRRAVPPELQPVQKFYRPEDASPFGLYKAFYRFGFSGAELSSHIPNDGDIYLVSSLFTTYAATVFELFGLIREKNRLAKIVAGGAHATIRPEEILRHGADFVIRGEGEVALPKLVAELNKNTPQFAEIPNLSWQDSNGNFWHNPVKLIENLNVLPFADYQITGVPDYRHHGRPHVMLAASRGCPHRCAFCCIHQTMGGRYRMRSVDNVLSEMTEKIAQGVRSFDFEDDHLGGDRDWFVALLQGIRERFTGLDIALHAMNGITAENLDEEILTAMWAAGFRTLNLALVTPSERRQKHLNRPFGTEKYLEVYTAARRIGFFITTYLIIGLPGDQAEELLRSVLFLAPLATLIGPSLFYLVPETQTFNRLVRLNKIPDSPLCYRSSFYPIDSQDCSRCAAMTLFRICRILNFMHAVIDSDPRPLLQINDDRLIIDRTMDPRTVRLNLGLGLLKLFFRHGSIYGTARWRDGGYPIVAEEADRRILDLFMKESWRISGLRRSAILGRDEFIGKYLGG